MVKMIRAGFPYGKLLASLTRVPVLGRAIEYVLFEDDDLMILPRESVVEVGEDITAGDDQILLPASVVEHFIERAGFIWKMDSCICRQSLKCSDYPIDLGCIFLGEAARYINPKLGREVTREEALLHMKKCREAGLYQLVGRNKLDSVWLGVKPGNRLLTICNCCTCCCLWRILPVVSGSISSKLTMMPGLRVEVSDRCAGCGTCVENGCVAGAITLQGGRAEISSDCRGCGRCAEVCPEGAIEVSIEDSDFIRRSIERISARVDVT
jgi:NAD-dependent dihydropyrimidine dehydrogenase PreA subunit